MGPRASGKSTVGRLLAARLHRRFIDLDTLILQRLDAVSVRSVWETRGEAAWRAAETETLATVLRADRQIVALGGGTPMIGEARALIQEHRRRGGAWLVYLECPVEELQRRLRGTAQDRPSLTGDDPVDEVAAVLSQREATYRSLADLVCDVTDGSPEQIAERLAREAPEGEQ